MLEALLARLRAQPSRTGSVIITLYGDAIAPRGGSLALSDLCAVFAAMGVGEGVVRTAVSRLAGDGWLERSKQGRRSFYRLAPRGEVETRAATPRIYGPLCPPDAGLVLVLPEPAPDRTAAEALGFGVIAPGALLAHAGLPGPPGAARLDLSGDPAVLRQIVARAWRLDDLAARYRAFLDLVADDPGALPAIEALVARVLLMHAYRRVVLRDPHLPRGLLPEDWPGFTARDRCQALHAALGPAAETWLDGAQGEAGPLPAAAHPLFAVRPRDRQG